MDLEWKEELAQKGKKAFLAPGPCGLQCGGGRVCALVRSPYCGPGRVTVSAGRGRRRGREFCMCKIKYIGLQKKGLKSGM